MHYKLFLLCLYQVILYNSHEEILSELIDEILLNRNIKFISYLYNKNDVSDIFNLIHRRYIRSNFLKLDNNTQFITADRVQNQLYCIFIEHFTYYQKDILGLLPTHKSTFLIITNYTDRLIVALRLINLQWDSNIIVISKQKDTSNALLYEIFDIYALNKNETFYNITFIGTWSLSNKIKFTNDHYRRRINLNGFNLRVPPMISHDEQYVAMEGKCKYLKTEQEINYTLLKLLRDIHNFSIKVVNRIYFTDFCKVTEDILLNELDITTGFMEETIVDFVDFIIPTYPYRKAFILKNPKGGVKNIFIRPFTSKVWYTILSFVFVLTIFLKVLLSISRNLHITTEEVPWFTVMFISLSIFLQQGTSIVPNFQAYRILFFTSLTTAVMLFNYYGASMVSSLLSDPIPHVKSISDLREARIKLGIEGMPGNYEMENLILNIHNFNDSIYNISDAVKEIRRGHFAYYTEPATRYKVLNTQLDLPELCTLIEVNVLPKTYVTIMVPKQSEFKEFFKISFRRIVEKGLLNQQLTKSLLKKPPCLAHVDVTGLTMKDVFPAFILFYGGVVLSILILILEHLYVKLFYD